MKTRNFLFVTVIALLLSGCVVYSFYPLYTRKDLFANEILTGTWTDGDGTTWKFEHPEIGKDGVKSIDHTSFLLTLKDKDQPDFEKSEFSVHVIKLGGNYFLDFFLKNVPDNDHLNLAEFHIIPVHTFAKLFVSDGSLQINWFDQEWLNKLIRQNKIRIHHESNDDFILLTAKPEELQKFVTKYVNSAEAFKDGMSAVLIKKAE